jgi:hypothetical protein
MVVEGPFGLGSGLMWVVDLVTPGPRNSATQRGGWVASYVVADCFGVLSISYRAPRDARVGTSAGVGEGFSVAFRL